MGTRGEEGGEEALGTGVEVEVEVEAEVEGDARGAHGGKIDSGSGGGLG